MLKEFEMTMDEFIDLCILCGCDYTVNIGGIGPGKSFSYIKKCQNIENVLKEVELNNENPKTKKKYLIPDPFNYVESRELFRKPDVLPLEEVKEKLKFGKPDEEKLKAFLCGEKGFAEAKVEAGIVRLKKAAGKGNQTSLSCFFKRSEVKTSSKSAAPPKQ